VLLFVVFVVVDDVVGVSVVVIDVVVVVVVAFVVVVVVVVVFIGQSTECGQLQICNFGSKTVPCPQFLIKVLP